MIHIKTKKGWKPLWQISPPIRPPYPDPSKSGPEVEVWRNAQLELLMQLRELADDRS